MSRVLLDFIVEYYQNRRRPLPRWLKHHLGKSGRLSRTISEKQLFNAVLQVAGRRQQDSLQAANEENTPAPAAVTLQAATDFETKSRSLPAWTAALALAASLLLAVWGIDHYETHADSQRAEVLAQGLAAVPSEVQTFFAKAARSSQVQVSRCSLFTNVSLPRTDLLQVVALGAQQQVETSTTNLLSPWHALRSEVEARLPIRRSAETNVDAVGS